MSRKILAIFSIVIGTSVIGLWILLLLSQEIPEGKTEMAFHLISEFTLGGLCLLSGILLLKTTNRGRILNMLALGMLLYSVLNAAGYYGEMEEYSMMFMFISLTFFTSIAIIINIKLKGR